jgi:hypothetical protein
MERFTYSVTDLDDYESEPVTLELNKEEAIAFAIEMAGDVLKSEPRLKLQGLCVALFDEFSRCHSCVSIHCIGSSATSLPRMGNN